MAASMAVVVTAVGAHASGSATQGLQDRRDSNLVVLQDLSGRHDIPEPTGWALMLVGLGGMGLVIRSRRRQDMAA